MNNKKELLFILDNVVGWNTVSTQIGDQIDVITLDAQGNALDQMIEVLTDYQNVRGIHLVSHGSKGRVNLGTVDLTSDNLADHKENLSALQNSMTDGGDLLLYGCDVAAAEEGEMFVSELAKATQLNVAASDDLTALTSMGGDWALESINKQVHTDTLLKLNISPLSMDYQDIDYTNINVNDFSLEPIDIDVPTDYNLEEIVSANEIVGAGSSTYYLAGDVVPIGEEITDYNNSLGLFLEGSLISLVGLGTEIVNETVKCVDWLVDTSLIPAKTVGSTVYKTAGNTLFDISELMPDGAVSDGLKWSGEEIHDFGEALDEFNVPLEKLSEKLGEPALKTIYLQMANNAYLRSMIDQGISEEEAETFLYPSYAVLQEENPDLLNQVASMNQEVAFWSTLPWGIARSTLSFAKQFGLRETLLKPIGNVKAFASDIKEVIKSNPEKAAIGYLNSTFDVARNFFKYNEFKHVTINRGKQIDNLIDYGIDDSWAGKVQAELVNLKQLDEFKDNLKLPKGVELSDLDLSSVFRASNSASLNRIKAGHYKKMEKIKSKTSKEIDFFLNDAFEEKNLKNLYEFQKDHAGFVFYYKPQITDEVVESYAAYLNDIRKQKGEALLSPDKAKIQASKELNDRKEKIDKINALHGKKQMSYIEENNFTVDEYGRIHKDGFYVTGDFDPYNFILTDKDGFEIKINEKARFVVDDYLQDKGLIEHGGVVDFGAQHIDEGFNYSAKKGMISSASKDGGLFEVSSDGKLYLASSVDSSTDAMLNTAYLVAHPFIFWPEGLEFEDLEEQSPEKYQEFLSVYKEFGETPATVEQNPDDPFNLNTVSLADTPKESQTLTPDVSLSSGDVVTNYQWYIDGNPVNPANPMDGLDLSQYHVGKTVQLRVDYINYLGVSEYIYSNATEPVENINNDTTGNIVINGTPNVGETLTVEIEEFHDQDGAGLAYFEWYADGEKIEGARQNTYTLTADEVGKHINVMLRHTDNYGSEEFLGGGPTDSVQDTQLPDDFDQIQGFIVGDQFQVNETLYGDQNYPAISQENNSGFVVAWASRLKDNYTDGILAQRFDSNGNPIGSEILVDDNVNYSRGIHIDIERLEDGGFIVAWSGDDDVRSVFLQKYSESGEKTGAKLEVGSGAGPELIQLNDGLLLHWSISVEDDSGWLSSYKAQVFSQKLDTQGSLVGSVNQMTSGEEHSQASLATLSSEESVLVSNENSIGRGVLSGKVIDSDGSLIKEFFVVESGWQPVVSILESGGFIVAWAAKSAYESGYDDIFAQRFDKNGNSIESAFLVNTKTDGSQGSPKIITFEDDSFLISWHGKLTEERGFKGQYFDADGNKVGEQIDLDGTEDNTQLPGDIALTDNNSIISVYEDFNDGSSEIFARISAPETDDSTPDDAEYLTVTGQQLRAAAADATYAIKDYASGITYTFGDSQYNIDTSQVTDMSGLFTNSYFNEDISYWDTSNVTAMGSMFGGSEAFNQDIGDWDTSNVTDMSRMFYLADAFNQDLSGWDVSQIDSKPSYFSSGSPLNNNQDFLPNWGEGSTPEMPEIQLQKYATVSEGAGQVDLLVDLGTARDQDVVVHYRTHDNDQGAQAGEDYVSAMDSITIQAGQTQGTVTIDLVDDEQWEPSEYFMVSIFDVEGAEMPSGASDRYAKVIIENDDPLSNTSAPPKLESVIRTNPDELKLEFNKALADGSISPDAFQLQPYIQENSDEQEQVNAFMSAQVMSAELMNEQEVSSSQTDTLDIFSIEVAGQYNNQLIALLSRDIEDDEQIQLAYSPESAIAVKDEQGQTLQHFSPVKLEELSVPAPVSTFEVDHPADESTHGEVEAGGSTTGTIEDSGDEDWFAVTLEAGTTYHIDLMGSDTGNGSLSDPVINGLYRVHEMGSWMVENTSNDDGGEGRNSNLEFTPDVSGTYYISASSFGEETGTYELRINKISDDTGEIPTGFTAAEYYLLDQDADRFNTDLDGDSVIDLLANINTNGLRFSVDGVEKVIKFDKSLLTGSEILNHEDFAAALQPGLQQLIQAGTVPADITLSVDSSRTATTYLDDGSISSAIPAIVLQTQSASVIEPVDFVWVDDVTGDYNIYGRFESRVNDETTHGSIMAKIFLGAQDAYRLHSGGATIFGAAGDPDDKVVIESDAQNISVNANIDRVDFPGNLADFKCQAGFGANMQVYAADGTTLIVSIPLQDDDDGTQLVFGNGAVNAIYDQGSISVGGQGLPAIAAAVNPDPSQIDFSVTSGSGQLSDSPVSTKVFLESGAMYREANTGTKIFGFAGDDNDAVIIDSDAENVSVNANVDRVDFPGNLADFKCQAGFGANMQVFAADGTTLIASIPLQEDDDGTQLVFGNGAVKAFYNQGQIKVGGELIDGIPGAIDPAASEIDPDIIVSTLPNGEEHSAKTVMSYTDCRLWEPHFRGTQTGSGSEVSVANDLVMLDGYDSEQREMVEYEDAFLPVADEVDVEMLGIAGIQFADQLFAEA